MYRRASSPRGSAAARIALAVVAIALCVGALWLFRRASAPEASVAAPESDGEVAAEEERVWDGEAALTAGGTAVRSRADGAYAITIAAQLPAIDVATTAYEAWYVKPGITDFFSLGELFPREDGMWGLAWTQPDALVRNDIEEFDRVILMREPRDGNSAPSSDQVAAGQF